MKLHECLTIGVITAMLGGCGGNPPAPPQAVARPEAGKTPAPPAPVVLPKVPEGKPLPPIAYEAKGRRDPFRSPPTDAEPPVNGPPAKPLLPMEVRGIISIPGGYIAIVNDQIVKVGDLVAGERVERITDRDVVLRQPDGSARSVTLTDFREARPTAKR